jgi:hypothetical protein
VGPGNPGVGPEEHGGEARGRAKGLQGGVGSRKIPDARQADGSTESRPTRQGPSMPGLDSGGGSRVRFRAMNLVAVHPAKAAARARADRAIVEAAAAGSLEAARA